MKERVSRSFLRESKGKLVQRAGSETFGSYSDLSSDVKSKWYLCMYFVGHKLYAVNSYRMHRQTNINFSYLV